MARILTISSMVARGHVGNSATSFPLMRLGHEVSALPTVVLAHHPGHADPARAEMPDLLPIGSSMLGSPEPHPVDAVLIGYIAVAPQASAVAGIVAEARALTAGIPVLVDPICGDQGALYVTERIVEEFAMQILPLADIATPNVTELAALAAPERLAQAGDWSRTEIIDHARSLGVPTVVVTSAPASGGTIANIIVTGDTAHCVETPCIDLALNGTGDLLSGLILARILAGDDAIGATAHAAAVVCDVMGETMRLGRNELALVQAQDRLSEPVTKAVVTQL